MIKSSNYLLLGIFVVAFTGAQVPVTILSIPAGANVTVDFNEIGVTPINNHEFTAGSYTFEVELDGYAKIIKTVDFHEAKHLEIEFRLNELLSVRFTSKIPDLKFETGGQTWEDRKVKLQMEAGQHRIIVYSGFMRIDSIIINVNSPMDFIYDPN